MNLPARFALLFLALPAAPLQAAVFCVNDNAGLVTAVGAVGTNQQSDEIRIRRGTYETPLGAELQALLTDNLGLTISGGWSGDNGACTTRINDAAATVLRRGYLDSGRVLVLKTYDQPAAEISLSNLTLADGFNTSDAGCLWMVSNRPLLSVERVIFTGCISAGDGGGAYLLGPRVRLFGNLFRENGAARGGAFFLDVSGNGSRADVSNNTAIANVNLASNQAGGAHLVAQSITSQVSLNNNIFWNNATSAYSYDLRIESGSPVYSFYDHIDRVAGIFANVPLGRTSGDPQLESIANPVPRQDSISRDSGYDTAVGGLPAIDLRGVPRPTGLHMDRGAYELVPPPDAIFATSFERAN
ncbi:choice-of-anchor Q domain-containing protein [Tahibacter harae]|uniref:Parallel beta helix pectate lyase-like protein n=1 Tax=Tahibacter harae TaxID=2963937 RepID=A0ABT1QYK5_9GAMM|nr:choice-of-anchor Q domain-containing protein [Tahibacter harae]MCQ4167367.1 hypothetical protein [Tahibacter harae]